MYDPNLDKVKELKGVRSLNYPLDLTHYTEKGYIILKVVEYYE